MLTLRSIFFTFLLPGTVTVVIPYFVVFGGHIDRLESWTLWHYLSLLPIIVGAGILFWCVWDFAVAGRGTLAPVDPPKHLVVRRFSLGRLSYFGLSRCSATPSSFSLSLISLWCSTRSQRCSVSLVGLTRRTAAAFPDGCHMSRMNLPSNNGAGLRRAGRCDKSR
jgi:hypothetical protein